MNPYVIGVLCGLMVILVPTLMIFKPSSRHQVNVLGEILDVDEVMAESRKARNIGKGKQFMSDHPKIFETLLKLSGIDLQKLGKEVQRADVKRFTAEDIVAIQMVALYGGGILMIALIVLHAQLVLLAMVAIIILMAFLYPRNKLASLIKTRQEEFVKHFPDFLDAMEIPLSNGLPVLRVFERVSERFPGIVGREFRRVVIETKAQGERIQRPLEDLVDRIPAPVVSDFVSAYTTALRTGTGLDRVVANMSRTIRVVATQQQEETNRKKVNPILMVTMLFYMFPYIMVTVAPMLIKTFAMISGTGF